MPAILDQTQLDSIFGELDAEKRQAILDAPRDKRIVELAQATGVEEGTLLVRLAEASGLPIATNLHADPSSLRLFPARLVNDFQIIPILDAETVARIEAGGDAEQHPDDAGGDGAEVSADSKPLLLATGWPPDASMVEWIRTFTGRPVFWHLGVAEKVHQIIVERFGVGSGSLEDDEGYEAPETEAVLDADVDEEAAVVRFVTDVISQAVADEATDIHFEPQEKSLRIRYRVDGLLVHVPVPENLLRFQDAIISRVKIMSKLNISEKRLPQDGRINFKSSTTLLDIRVSTLPTIYGESISLRLLNKKKEAQTMERLGMSAEEQAKIAPILLYPHGVILITGPTGSGKSTSLNAFLRKINAVDLRIMTVEDPIEYELPGVNQTQIKPEIGLTFASALRSLLRQDPDVIMIGEIRDRETADIAIRASLTGHLVFSTLHTNDAPGAITRLVDMGVEPFLVASAVELVIAQRLVRRLCVQCAKFAPTNAIRLAESLTILHADPAEAQIVKELKNPVGCDRCRGTGYRGRVGLFEIFRLSDELHQLILRRESTQSLAECARRGGMMSLEQSGWEKVKVGLTTLDEVLSVVTITESAP